MEYKIVNKCRACLAQDKLMLSLVDNYENNLSIADILQYLLKIQLKLCDNLPKEICHECATLLVQFYNFSITFHENNKQFEDYIESNKEYTKCIFDSEVVKEEFLKNEDQNECDIFFVNKETNTKKEIVKSDIKSEINKYECDDDEETSTEINDCEEIIICTTNENISAVTQHKCTLCDKTFDNSSLLKRHVQLHLKNKKYICEVCGYISLKKSYLADHMTMHTKEKRHTCNFCGKTFRQRSAFSRHKKIHTNPMQEICEKCGQKFTDRGTLKTHILLLHMKTRNFKCIICNESFPLKGTLDKHLRRHQQKDDATKNFSCTECNMKYFDKSSLKRHCITKHSNRNIKHKCQYCSKEYTAKNNLFKHICVHHKEFVDVT